MRSKTGPIGVLEGERGGDYSRSRKATGSLQTATVRRSRRASPQGATGGAATNLCGFKHNIFITSYSFFLVETQVTAAKSAGEVCFNKSIHFTLQSSFLSSMLDLHLPDFWGETFRLAF